MTRYIFIVSTGRTATRALSDCVNARVDRAESYHEPRPSFARRAPALIARGHRRSERIHLGLPRRWRRVTRRKAVHVEFNHHLFSSLPLIRRTFPGACVIHIVRDGRTTVRSWLNKGRYTHADNFMTPTDVPGSGVALEDWLTWSPVKKNAWSWALVNGVIDAQAPDYRVHFEHIFDPGRNELARVFHEIAPDVFDPGTLYFPDAAPAHDTRNPDYAEFEQWSESRQRDFWELAGPQMRAFGYATNAASSAE